MSYFVRAYLRASSNEQDAQRARSTLERFAQERNVMISNYYAENESGARLDRPELFRLLSDSRASDVLLVEDVDRLSRLSTVEWGKLKNMIRERQKQGIAKAKTEGKYSGRQINHERYAAINRLLASGSSWSVVQRTIGCSRSTISSARKHASDSTQKQNTVSDMTREELAIKENL